MNNHTKEILDGLREPTWKWGFPPEVQAVLDAAKKLYNKLAIDVSLTPELRELNIATHNFIEMEKKNE